MKPFLNYKEFTIQIKESLKLPPLDLPFVFSDGYNNYLQGLGYETFYYIENKRFTLIGFKKSKFVSSAYLIFPPLENNERLSPDDELTFYARLIKDVKRYLKPDQIIPHVPIEVSQVYPSGYKNASFGNVSIDLKDKSSDELFSNFQSSNRNIIRKAIRENAYVKFGEAVFDDFYELYADTHKRQNIYHDPKEVIYNLYQSIKDSCICAVVYTEDHIPEGSIFVPFSVFGGYSYFAGSAAKPTIRGAVKLLHWEVIQELIKNNVNRFVLGGARVNPNLTNKQKGMRDFKMSFGSSIQHGYLWKVNYSPVKNFAYQKAVKLKMKLNGVTFLPDIIDQINEMESASVDNQ